MNDFYKANLLVLTLIISVFSFGQNFNSYKFIEPNISVSYDGNLFKISNRYSNSLYETEAYDFAYQLDQTNNIFIHVEADRPGPTLSTRTIDSVMLIDLKTMKNEIPKSLSIISIDTMVRHLNGFSFIGIVAYDKKKKEYGTSVRGFHVTKNDKTEIRYFSKNRNDLEKEYGILKLFLQDFKSYSRQKIEQEDSLIKREYTVRVQATKELSDDLKFRRKTYSGIVTVEQPLKHKIAEVRLAISVGRELFLPDENGVVPIVCYDVEKGNIEKKGELIILNSFGKKVKIPFIFSYENLGIQPQSLIYIKNTSLKNTDSAILYIGVENMIEIEGAQNNVSITVTGATIKKVGAAKFIVIPSKPGRIAISVSQDFKMIAIKEYTAVLQKK